MKWKEIKNKTWFKTLKNKYFLVGVFFVFWMLFFDANSWLIHHELNQEKKELLSNKRYYEEEITKDKKILNQLKDSIEIEKFAREEYYMKRPDEEIYIIEYSDSLN